MALTSTLGDGGAAREPEGTRSSGVLRLSGDLRGSPGTRRVGARRRGGRPGVGAGPDAPAGAGRVPATPLAHDHAPRVRPRRSSRPGLEVFSASQPGEKLVGDITYVHTWAGFLYLATVIDCHTKAVIGWSMADHMKTSLISQALDRAVGNVTIQPDCVFHSGRGAQYTSAEFHAHLARSGIRPSVGRTGVCWDNAMDESFFGALKNELVHRTTFPDHARARTAIARYIEVFYNRTRLHSALGYKTPREAQTEFESMQLTP